MRRLILFAALLCFIGIPLRSQAQAPDPPTNLSASLVSAEGRMVVELDWSYPVLSGGTHRFFRIHRSVDDDMHFLILAATGDTSFVDIRVPSGHKYFYFVTALTYTGDEESTTPVAESAPSDTVSVFVTPPPTPPHGTIAGTVTDSVTGKPIRFVHVEFFRKLDGWEDMKSVWTDTAGHYSAELDTGMYLIHAVPLFFWPGEMSPIAFSLYKPEWFDDAFEVANATPVTVSDHSTFTADFDLQRIAPPVMATVHGTVTDTSGNALKHALVVFFRPFAEMPRLDSEELHPEGADNDDVDIDDIGRLGGVWRKVWTDSLGDYSVMLESGRSYIAMAVKEGYLPQFFDHKSDPRNADVIHLGGDTSGINFSLTPRPVATASISGMVRDSSGAGIASRVILIPLAPHRAPRFGSTDSVGNYLITHVWDGKYFVLAIPVVHGYAPAFYKAGAFGVMQWQLADTVSISGTVTGIDIGVIHASGDGAGTIAGTITGDGAPLPGVNVYAMDGGWNLVGFALTDNVGSYVIDGITAGQFSIVAARDGYATTQSIASVPLGTFAVSGINMNMVNAGPSSVAGAPTVPADYALNQNYPNPFNPGTTISFAIPAVSTVRLTVYNVLGQEIATLKNGVLPAGRFDAQWSGRDDAGRAVSSGIYFYKLDASPVAGGNSFSGIRKMVLLK